MKKIIIATTLALCAFGVRAENEPAATSKEYVDAELATKQPTVPAAGENVVMTFDSTATDGIGTKNIYDPSGSYAAQQDALVTAATANAAVQMAINGEFVCHEYSTIDPTDCWLWKIKEPVSPSRNLFDISKVQGPSRSGSLVNNGDGSITVTDAIGNSAICNPDIKLSDMAPELVAGGTYTLSLDSTGRSRSIYIWGSVKEYWKNGASKTITQDWLDAYVCFYANYNGVTPSTATISNIQIEEGTVATPYQPYGQNTFLPQTN